MKVKFGFMTFFWLGFMIVAFLGLLDVIPSAFALGFAFGVSIFHFFEEVFWDERNEN